MDGRVNLDFGEGSRKTGPQDVVGDPGYVFSIPYGHHFNETDVQHLIFCEGSQAEPFVIVYTLLQHHIDLGPEARIQGSVDAVQNLTQHVSACDPLKLCGIQSIQTDIDRIQARRQKLRKVFFQQHAIRGHRDLLHPGDFFQRGDEARAAKPRKGLAAGDFEIPDAEPDSRGAGLHDLLIGHDLSHGNEGNTVRHAVAAS